MPGCSCKNSTAFGTHVKSHIVSSTSLVLHGSLIKDRHKSLFYITQKCNLSCGKDFLTVSE